MYSHQPGKANGPADHRGKYGRIHLRVLRGPHSGNAALLPSQGGASPHMEAGDNSPALHLFCLLRAYEYSETHRRLG